MKIRLVLIVNIIALFLISQFYLAVTSNRIEDRSTYKVVHVNKNFEIRKYNSIALEVINSQAHGFKEYSKNGIKNVKQFGLMDNTNSAKFSILMVSRNLNSSQNVRAQNQPSNQHESYLAVVSFDGFAFENDIKKYAKTMVLALKKANIRHYGNFHFVGYNSFFQLFKRRNEVIVHINYK
jgi:hypothetical protein